MTDSADDDYEGEEGIWNTIREHLNFYRVHVMFYTFTPLIFSGVFYASNGQYHIPYIDALFNCVSAMTVCGLVTVNLSSLTAWQQVILFIQMCVGSPVFISWVVVLLRRHYFAKKFDSIIAKYEAERAASALVDAEKTGLTNKPWARKMATFSRHRDTNIPTATEAIQTTTHVEKKLEHKPRKQSIIKKLRPDMIRRMDDAPKLINPSGFAVPLKHAPTSPSNGHIIPTPYFPFSGKAHLNKDPKLVRRSSIGYDASNGKRLRRLSDPGVPSRPGSPVPNMMQRSDTVGDTPLSPEFPKVFPRTQTIEFAPITVRRRGRAMNSGIPEDGRPDIEPVQPSDHRSLHSRQQSLSYHPSINTHATEYTHQTRRTSRSTKNRGFGGFPMPYAMATGLFDRVFPNIRKKLSRTVTIPHTTSYVPTHENPPPGAKSAPYISFRAIVGRNSAFHELTHEQMEELGGVEFRALNALLWIVGGYHIVIQLLSFIVIAPYISTGKWKDIFLPPQQIRPVPTPWFSLFQSISAYTNTGFSLVDQSMVPFQTAYPMIFLMAFLILAGNTAFPVFLRFTIWIVSKCVPRRSRIHETLHFLLDHPRRCFIFLFPSHQTWFLFTIVFFLTVVDWFFFLVLDIGNPVVEDIPLGTRFVVGMFQAVAVRSAGFSAVSIAALAAGVKVLFVVMMYISVYPIAMSVRSTNVYEEQSLGVFPSEEDLDEVDFEASGPRVTVWSRYLAMHARKQLAFDMWWLGLALFLLCIIERHNIDDPASQSWFNIFSVVFDLVSAYGTVGLSLGNPTENYSFAGAFKPLSKFILCLVMIRGRHRILPVAIDRATREANMDKGALMRKMLCQSNKILTQYGQA
ncbi:cation transport protein-domain-containing protein [Collybia nuda]|uniref:Potassium transport protein n=1 Tax=Collybia nuda TaxID=64659 RepID=A0A9P5Y7G1_9AGAR|nr:cation transport protein-domain-containing protein [Collybia nuda]